MKLTGAEHGSLATLLRGRAEATPDARFLRWQGEWTTYAEALAASAAFAGFLKSRGSGGPETRVATYLPNCPEALWCWFGTNLSGSVYVALNRGHRGDLLREMLRRSRASILLTDSAGIEEVGDLSTSNVHTLITTDRFDGPRVAGVDIIDFASVCTSDHWLGRSPDPFGVGSVMYTSGSTGRSKAVLMPNNQHARGGSFVADSFAMRPDDVWHGWAPLYHVMAQMYVILGSIASGGGVALQPRFSRSQFWKQVCEGECTIIGGVASVMRMVWTVEDDEFSRLNPARLALISGAFADLHDAFQDRYAVRIVDCYGMTEAEPMTLPVVGDHLTGSHGFASPDYDVAVLDPEDRPLNPGAVGEIACRPRTPGTIFLGYEDDSDATVRSWRNLWFHTGDLGFVGESGRLHFLDRRKHGIRRSGENISPGELEELLHGCPWVASAVAVGIPREPGEDDIKVVVVLHTEDSVTATDLHAWCTDHMARFMVPRYIEIVAAMPLLAYDKIDRASLAGLNGTVWDSDGGPTTTPVGTPGKDGARPQGSQDCGDPSRKG